MGLQRYYYLKDHTSATLSTGLGSVRVTLNETGAVAGYDYYYTFGLQLPGRSSNTANTHADQNACPDASGFTGHFLESEGDLGLYHAQARLYDPEVPRFYGVDNRNELYPHFNSYQYGLNNPIIYTDPTGECIAELPCPEIVNTILDNYAINAEITSKTSVGIQASAEVLRFKGFTANLGSVELTSSTENYTFSTDGIEQTHFETSRITNDSSFKLDQSLSISGYGLGVAIDNNSTIDWNDLSTSDHIISLTPGVGPAYAKVERDMINKKNNLEIGNSFSINMAAIVGFSVSINVNLVRRDEVVE
jgi:RHS repeat-associated protein